jgi:hypothetical protein
MSGGFSLEWELNSASPLTAIDFIFKVNLNPTVPNRPPTTEVKKTVKTEQAWFSSWHHLVVTKLQGTVTIYLDGVSIIQTTVCSNPVGASCDISFPICNAIENRQAGTSNFVCTSALAARIRLLEPMPFVIGAVVDNSVGLKYRPHYGYIMSVRILSKALSLKEIKELYAPMNNTVIMEGPIPATTYWVRSTGESPILSPSTRHCDVAHCPDVTVMGKFQVGKSYSCRWSFQDSFSDWKGVISNSNYTCASKGGTCEPQDKFVNMLVCKAQNPVWNFGYKAVTLRIVEKTPGSPLKGKILWQRVCLQASCGYATASSYKNSKTIPDPFWWVNWGKEGINFGLSRGDITLFTFQTVSKLLSYNGSDIQDGGTINSSLGASKAVHFTSGGSFLAVSNYWDGRTTKTLSPILQLTAYGPQVVQVIPTFAATGWEFFELNGKQYLAISNYAADTSIYRYFFVSLLILSMLMSCRI